MLIDAIQKIVEAKNANSDEKITIKNVQRLSKNDIKKLLSELIEKTVLPNEIKDKVKNDENVEEKKIK